MTEIEALRLRVRRLEEIVAKFFTGNMDPSELDKILNELKEHD